MRDVRFVSRWQTQRSLEHFSIGQDLIPREMITAYATLKKAAANANHADGRLNDAVHRLVVQACDEILAGQHHDMFPLHVWMTGSGTQFNMNDACVADPASLPARERPSLLAKYRVTTGAVAISRR